mmetsp:Transcript_16491/g.45223  ORF Transcript_16491/g.45223 Transcript_16491/m.45223 type:complete len:370 (-) Transcript_16491:667-1776(-)
MLSDRYHIFLNVIFIAFACGMNIDYLSSSARHCWKRFEGHGLDPARPLEAFSGYYLNSFKETQDFQLHGSEMICFLNGTHVLRLVNNAYATANNTPWRIAFNPRFVNNTILFMRLLKTRFRMLSLPKLLFRITTSDSGIPLKTSARMCLHPSGIDFSLCQGSVVLPVHDNQRVDRMSEYIRKAVSEMGTEWERKRKVAYWRGGNHPPHHSSLRNRLVHLAINSSLLDARFGAYSWDKFIECKIILAVDGYGHFSNIIKRALLSGSVVARVDHKVGTGEWFEPFLIPYHNFLPIRFDLSNLQDVVQWAIENDEASRMIARNAFLTFYRLFEEEFMLCYGLLTIEHWSHRQQFERGTVENFEKTAVLTTKL